MYIYICTCIYITKFYTSISLCVCACKPIMYNYFDTLLLHRLQKSQLANRDIASKTHLHEPPAQLQPKPPSVLDLRSALRIPGFMGNGVRVGLNQRFEQQTIAYNCWIDGHQRAYHPHIQANNKPLYTCAMTGIVYVCHDWAITNIIGYERLYHLPKKHVSMLSHALSILTHAKSQLHLFCRSIQEHSLMFLGLGCAHDESV